GDQVEIDVPPVDENAPDPERHRAALRELAAMRRTLTLAKGLPEDCPWQSVGPTNIHGRITGIAIDPTNRNRLFVTTVGGVWRSLDFARRWERVSDGIFSGVFGSVAINPVTPNEVFVGGGDPNAIAFFKLPSFGVGIWRSTTGGGPGSWSKTSPAELDDSVIYRLRVDPKAPNDIYAAASSGVWRGTHNGAAISWIRLGSFDAWTSDIVIDASGAQTLLYAGAWKAGVSFAKGIWKWDGSAWLPMNNGIDMTNSRTIRLAIAKSSPQTLYARVTGTNEMLQGIYKTTNGGGIWTELPGQNVVVGEIQSPTNYCASGATSPLEVDPTDPQLVYSGCFAMYRSTNGGTSFNGVSGGADNQYPYFLHVDQHAIAFDPVNPKIVYIGHDGGLDRSTDTSVAPWHWTGVSHGMVIWQMYHVAAQSITSTMAAGGAQDTGTGFTFGNRAWYHQWDCDGTGVSFDAKNLDMFYVGCQGPPVQLRTNPVPGTAGYGTTVTTSQFVYRPLAADRDLTRHALAITKHDPCANATDIVKSVDSVNYSSISPLPSQHFVNAMHIVPGSAFQHYYAGIVDCGTDQTAMWRTTDGGGMWNKNASGVPPGRVAAIDADPEAASGDRAFAAFPTSIVMTTDGGASWTSIDGAGATALPPSAVRRGVVIDPIDTNVVYAATDVGIFRGTLGGGSATWVPFDEGMPSGVDVRELVVQPSRKLLLIGTWGFGTWRRIIDPAVPCPSRELIVRDNVFDRGTNPSPSGIPDPEHPLQDLANPPFFKPDDTTAGKLYWWSSTDVRIDVPDADPFANQLANVDHVELETCPVLVSQCPPGTLLDSHPRRGKPARAYVQVHNRGYDFPVMNARVIALWTDTTTSTPLLPSTFWTSTFPPPGTPCGALAPGSPWHLVDPASPCRTIARIDPSMPEVARFDWAVPANAPERACFLTIVESADDPLPASIRANNVVSLFNIVPQNRHMTVRNLHIVDPPAPAAPKKWFFAEALAVPNPTPDPDVRIFVGELADLRILLPRELDESALRNVRKVKAELSDEEQRFARAEGFDPAWSYLIGADASMNLP
ncbi:MAG TPA: hypothetical protein VN181_02165, partial [Thermoanaerobaculia bacterium]|nr:hypothetical protein [Thermoanaerobaculia bacterium]